ncbi:MAG TPA: ParA family protein [Kiloniellaceae bacterium]|nr:ParA family protein [Kiloniellaceae bacterium]
MLAVLITNSKGGCGKTTIATNIASAFAAGGKRTAVADADSQRSCLAWLQRRPETAPAIRGLDWVEAIGSVPKKTERLIIDSSASLDIGLAKDLVRMADVIVVPVLPSFFDQDSTAQYLAKLETLKKIRKNKRAVCVVRNRVRRRTRAASHLDRFMIGVSHSDAGSLPDRTIYNELALSGLGIFDVHRAGIDALRQEWSQLLQLLEQEA